MTRLLMSTDNVTDGRRGALVFESTSRRGGETRNLEKGVEKISLTCCFPSVLPRGYPLRTGLIGPDPRRDASSRTHIPRWAGALIALRFPTGGCLFCIILHQFFFVQDFDRGCYSTIRLLAARDPSSPS